MLELIKTKRPVHTKYLDLPKYKTNEGAGIDLCAAIKDEIIIEKNNLTKTKRGDKGFGSTGTK